MGNRRFVVIDTGGISGDEDGIDSQMAGQSLTAIEEADAVRRIIDEMEGDHRLLLHGRVNPNQPGDLDSMDELAERWKVAAWKTYTQWGPDGTGFFLSDEDVGIPFIEKARSLGVKRIAVHKGIPFGRQSYEHSQCSDIGKVAKRFPDAEYRDTWVWFQSGINTDGAHNPVTARALRRGDILSLNTFPMISGYYTALERTLFVGACDPASLAIWEANVAAHELGISLLKPGASCAEVTARINDFFAERDLLQYRTFGYGHSFGVLSHYYGREAGLELREDIDTVLEPGMVITLEPGVDVSPGKIMVAEENIVIRDSAPEFLSDPAGLDIPILEG